MNSNSLFLFFPVKVHISKKMKGEIFYGNINGYRGIITQLGEGEQELGKLGKRIAQDTDRCR